MRATIVSIIFFPSASETTRLADMGLASNTGKKFVAQTAPWKSGRPSGVRGRPGSAASEVGT
jgi:hypothetical protein